MKTLLTKKLWLVVLLVSTTMIVSAQRRKKANRDTEQWRYEIQGLSTGAEGTYLVKVFSYSKKPQIAIEQAKKNAIHGIVFKGFAGKNRSCPSQKPLVRDANTEEEHKDFFKNFFADGGKYMKFVSLSTDGAIAAQDRMKIGKKKYKIGVIVSVSKDALRKYLEQKGIIKSLSSVF